MTAPLRIYVDNDNMLRLDGLATATGTYVNDATVEATVTDDEAAPIEGETWPVVLEYIEDSNGRYEVLLPSTLVLTDQQVLVVEVTAEAGALNASWSLAAIALLRRS